MSQIKCKNCHQNIDSSDKFCPHCGAVVQQTTQEENIFCPKCGHPNPSGASFCEKCGTPLEGNSDPKKTGKKPPKILSSTGTYSGTMVKSKSSKSYKIFKTIVLSVIVIGIIALIIWFKVDPDAKEKLINVLFSVGFILIFGFFIWRKNKGVSKNEMIRRRRRSDSDKLYDKDNDSDDDDSDDDFDDDDYDDD